MIWVDTTNGTWGDADDLVIVEDYDGVPTTDHPMDVTAFGWAAGAPLAEYIRVEAEQMLEDA